MIMKKTSLLLTLLFLTTTIFALPENEWKIKKGEKLTYKISFFSMLTRNIKGGNATLSVLENNEKRDGQDVYHAVLKGKTSGVIEWLYKINNHYESYMDKTTLFPQLYIQKVKENKYSNKDTIVFDHNSKMATKNGDAVKIHKGTNDFVSMLYAVRQKDMSKMKKGETFLLPIFVDKKSKLSKVKYIGEKSITTKYGTRTCYGLKPEVPKGKLFSKKYPATIWISADKDRLIMYAEVKMRVGKIKLEMLKAHIPE